MEVRGCSTKQGKPGLEPGGWGSDHLPGYGGLSLHLRPGGDFFGSHGSHVSRLHLASRHVLFSSYFSNIFKLVSSINIRCHI